MTKPSIVLDKSFLFSATKKRIEEISASHKILMCDSLLYELVKDEDKKRAALFKKLPTPPCELEYIPTVSDLLRTEFEQSTPCKHPSAHIKQRDYSIIKSLSDENYTTPEPLTAVKDTYFSENENIFKMKLKSIREKYNKISHSQAQVELRHLLNTKIRNREFINGLIKSNIEGGAHIQEKFYTEEWATFRYHQIFELFILDTRARYSKFEDIETNEKVIEKIRHDLHDINYLILGILQGGFATKEKKLIKWWNATSESESILITN